MLTKIQLAADANVIDISVLDYPLSPYTLKGSSGFDPPDFDVTIADKFGHGGLYKGRRAPPKDIMLKIGISPDFTNADPVGFSRDILYNILETSTDGLMEIRLIDSIRPTLIIPAVVEKFVNPISNKEIEVQITFLCPQPYFTTTADVVTTPSLSTYNVTYEGTVNIGFVVNIGSHTSEPDNWVQITKSQTGEFMRFTGPTLTNYIYLLDTREGSRSVKKSIGGVISNGLHTIGSDYDWLKLSKGLNTFVITALAGSPTITSFTYRPAYWGI